MGTVNILIAEDNEKYAKYYVNVIEHLNSLNTHNHYFKAEVVKDGYEAYNRLTNLDYDFVIFEEYLPNMKASEILEKLYENKRMTCSVLITKTGSEKLAVKGFRLGIKNYWRKENLGEADLEKEILKCSPDSTDLENGKSKEKRLSEEHSHTFFVFAIVRNPGFDNLHSRDALDAIYQTIRNMFEAKVHEYGGRIISSKANSYLASFHESYNFSTMTVLCAIEVFSSICLYNLSESNNTLSRLKYKICLHKGRVKDEKNTEIIISEDLNVSVHMSSDTKGYNFVISQPIYEALDDKLKEKFIESYEFENYKMYYYRFWQNIIKKGEP